MLTGLGVVLRIYKLWCEGEALRILKRMLGVGLIGWDQCGYLGFGQIMHACIYKVPKAKTGERS